MNILLLILMATGMPSLALADTVSLKDGRKIEGKILEKTDKSVKIEANGVPMTFYTDELLDPNAPAAPSAPTAGPLSAEKRALILKFIEVFGTRAAMTQNMDAMLKSLPQDDPQLKEVKEKIKIDEIINRLIPLYHQQFTEDDLKIYIDFYSSAPGRKLILGISSVLRDSIAITAQYFKEKIPDLAEE